MIALSLVAAVLLPVPSAVGAAKPQPSPSTTGRFIVHCQPTMRGPVDPIRAPGAPGQSHLHDFFGATRMETFTVEELAGMPSSCSSTADRSTYWAPALLLRGKPVEPVRMQAYYQVNNLTRPYPDGFVHVAGNMLASRTDTARVKWICGGAGADRISGTVQRCKAKEYLMAVVTFGGCSDGRATSADHRSHVRYADQYGRCPASHPRHVPQLSLFLQWSCNAVCGSVTGFRLASGSTGGLHADFVSGWEAPALAGLIGRCNARDCGVIGELPALTPITPVG